MPVYEYTCSKCQAKFEKLVRSMSGAEKIKCPSCGSSKTQREMSVFAVPADGGGRAEMPEACRGCGGDGPCPMRE